MQCRERARAGAAPAARGNELRVVVHDVELVDAPLVARGLGLDVEAPQPLAAELELLRGDVERRQVRLRALRLRFRRSGGGRGLGDRKAIEAPGKAPPPLPAPPDVARHE